jgi:RNA polymerase sporulation-specific sigma factor
MDALVRTHLALVKYVVRRYVTGAASTTTCIRWAVSGSSRRSATSIRPFDVRFSTYAVPVILGEIRRFLRDDAPSRVSRSIKENAVKVYRFIETYEAAHQKEPGRDEIASALSLSREDALLALDSARPTRSFSEPVAGDGSLTLGDTLERTPPPGSTPGRRCTRCWRNSPKKGARHRTPRYFSRHTQSEIAQDYGMTQVQVPGWRAESSPASQEASGDAGGL